MKFNKTLALIVTATVVSFSACNDNYESLPVDQYTYDYLFSTTDSAGNKALGLLSSIYDVMQNGHNRVGGDYLDAASDDAISIHMNGNPDVLKLQLGQYTANTRIASDMQWSTYYSAIRKANILIGGIDRVPFKATYVNALGQTNHLGISLKAEARFLRAYFYFELIKRYGGVPLMGDKVYNINDDIELPRNSFEDCIKYITSELDIIQDSLRSIPMENPGQYAHAVTKQACMALKSRALLYAASPLFNEKPIENGNILIGYASYDKNRWKLAANAAKEFINTYGHKGDGTFKLAPKFRDIFLNFYQATTNPELIFFRQGDNGSTRIENTNGPLGFTGTKLGNGRTNPTQNLVDVFPMKDGHVRGESTTYAYDPQNPYANRDPRLDMTILHNGSRWLGTTLDTHQGGANNPSSAGDYSLTSYYMCKFMGDFTSKTEYNGVLHLWVMFRYAEILLNFAEAENESLTQPSQDVYDAIIELRKRAGIEPGSDNLYGLKANMTQEEMRKTIHNERRIELAFEEHRFFDIRRWREAEDIYKTPLKGMSIIQGKGHSSYSETDVLEVDFDAHRYLYPIPYSEVNKNKNMVQNPNWK